MQNITDANTYNQRVEEYLSIHKNKSIPLNERIAACEEIVYCDFCKENNRFDCMNELLDLYKEAGRHQDIINYIMFEFKSRFKDDEFHDAETNWFLMIAALDPSLGFRVVDAEIAKGDYYMAKGSLAGLKENRFAMLNMHQNDGLRDQCIFWYSHALAKAAQIAILEGDASTASDYLTDSFWKEFDYVSVESTYYMAKVWSGTVSPTYKDSFSLELYERIADLDTTSENFDDEDREMIIDANYQLGLSYATDSDYADKDKAKVRLEKAMKLGYPISSEEIAKLLQSIPQKAPQSSSTTTSNSNTSSSGGCYVATCVYGSYDCPQVWTLRRFRDNTLSKSPFGRAFIKVYYGISPTAVKMFGRYKWFRTLFKKPLDKWVKKLNQNGVKDTPYKD